MATYIDHESGTTISITGPAEGYTISLPSHRTIKAIENQLKDMQEFVDAN